jgi:hypothetical protein
MTPIMSKRKWSVSKRWRRFAGLAGIVGLAVMVQINTPTHAQQTASAGFTGQLIEPTSMITVEAAEERSVADMPSAAPGLLKETQPPPFLTDLPADVYKTMKEQAANEPAGVRGPPGAQALQALAPPTLKTFNFNGVSQTVACPGCMPPDPHGAVGKTHFVQVTNSHLDIYTIAVPPVLVKSVTLNAFFGEVDFLYDPRAVYDPIWNRWIIVATRSSTSATDTVHKFRLAVSKTASPTGAYWIYDVNFSGVPIQNGDYWDYPMLGFDQDAVLITGNIFTFAGAYRTTAMMPIAKARVYNGRGLTFPLFTSLAATLAPPLVQDQNANAYFVAANNGTSVHLYRGTNLSNPANATLVLQALVQVPAYSAPPDAPQPGTAVLLDTSDRRFVNASSQVGDSLWNVHSINSAGFATPRFYQIDTEGAGANTLKQQGSFAAAAGTSHDWNASIAANALDEAFVNWSSVDAIAGINAQVRFSGRLATDPLGVIPAGSVLFQSPTFYAGFGQTSGTAKWGDYSVVSLQPNANGTCAANRRAWITNQNTVGTTSWGSRIGRIGFC